MTAISGDTGALLLRPGCRAKGGDVVTILRRVIARLRQAWPHVAIVLRGDSHFSVPEVHAFCREQNLQVVFGQSINRRLKEQLAPTVAQAQALFDAALADSEGAHRQAAAAAQAAGLPMPPPPTIAPVRLSTEFTYQADTGDEPLRTIAKAEVSARGTNSSSATDPPHRRFLSPPDRETCACRAPQIPPSPRPPHASLLPTPSTAATPHQPQPRQRSRAAPP